jgi:chromosome condensin MukBEF ATPase and DNA-binding subunit MukB
MKNFKKQLESETRRQERQKMSRAKELVKLLERLIKQDHLYTEERLVEMKEQLRSVKEQIAEAEKLTSKGFGK